MESKGEEERKRGRETPVRYKSTVRPTRRVNPLRLPSPRHSFPQSLPHQHYPILPLFPITGSTFTDTTTAYLLSQSPLSSISSALKPPSPPSSLLRRTPSPLPFSPHQIPHLRRPPTRHYSSLTTAAASLPRSSPDEESRHCGGQDGEDDDRAVRG